MMFSLYEEVIIFILVVQTALFSLFLIILFKRLQKLIYDNNNLRKNLYDKLEELTLTITNFSTFILKSDIFSANSSLKIFVICTSIPKKSRFYFMGIQ